MTVPYSADIEAPTTDSYGRQNDAVTSGGDGKNGTYPQAKKPKLGWLLDPSLTPAQIAKKATKSWLADEVAMRERLTRWRVNRLRRKGVIGVFAYRTDKDRADWQVHIPLGAKRVPPTMNKAARLCRRLKANLFVDPPTPEGVPETDTDEARSSAEFSQRVLVDLGGPKGYNDLRSARRAFDLAATYDSAFRHFRVNPRGGGMEPRTIEASASARTINEAVQRWVPIPLGPDGVTPLVPVDPTLLDPAQPGMMLVNQPAPYVTRYVALDGFTITDDPAQAAIDWLPSIEVDLLTGRNVRMSPSSCQDISEAKMVHIAALLTVKEIKDRCPDAGLETWDDQRIKEMCKYRPETVRELLPSAQRDLPNGEQGMQQTAAAQAGDSTNLSNTDNLLCFVLTTYAVQQSDYPEGAYVISAGETEVLCQETWSSEVEGKKVKKDIPLDHFKGFEEGEDDPYGFHLMHLLGPGNELRAVAIGSYIEHLDRFNRRKTFYPWNAPFTPKEMQGPMGDYLPYNPQIGTVVHEQPPDYPQSATDFLDRVTTELDDESALQAQAQGLNGPEVQSGLHAQTILDTVATGLSDIRQSTQDAIERGWTIVLQLVRDSFTKPQRIAFVGDDNRHKEREWTGSDLVGVKSIRVMKGSFTMLSPSGKMAIAEHANALGIVSPVQLKHIALGNVGGLLGMQDDVHHNRVKRQISDFMEGPPPETEPALLAELASSIFDPRLTDQEPEIAQVRLYELGLAISGTKYEKLSVDWRKFLDAEYMRMQQVLMPPPAPPPTPGEGGGGKGGLNAAEGQPASIAQGIPAAPVATGTPAPIPGQM